MASGYFPLDHKHDGAGLVDALNSIESVLDQDWLEGTVLEDAMADGGYLAKLRLAANFIHDALDFVKRDGCTKSRCRAYRYYSGGGKIIMVCDGCGIDGHDSDCATHNEPEIPNGPCDCSVSQ